MKTLTPREEKIIKMRFGLEDGSQHTLAEVGQTFALTRERIRQIEAKALRKLATPRARANSAYSPPAAPEARSTVAGSLGEWFAIFCSYAVLSPSSRVAKTRNSH